MEMKMRRVTKKVTFYKCEVCRTEYKTIREAMRCEGSLLEEKKFKVDDLVKAKRKHHCDRSDREFVPTGRVVKITGPVPVDHDFSVRILSNKLLNQHAFQYIVSGKCICGEKMEYQFYSPEIKLVKPK
jgi:hypothetical protein